ncbi:MAG: guanylate kinase [Chroococcidiopsidaceae cyanobacterium CP_BM_RX_35]|nr:guanylate kinase [Chroococcidiopsidaceae cyanobacterium CP_BM_RX_35]
MTRVLPTSTAIAKESLPSGRLIILTGPSGVGKGTLVRSLLQRHPELYLSRSVTTRSPRPGEIAGQHYDFISRSQFEQMITADELLEWAEFAGNYYGTPYKPVIEQIAQGKWVLLEIELEGARKVRQKFPLALRIFILPPSLVELEQRLRRRGQDSEVAIVRRLDRARSEIKAASEFDIQIINDNFETALSCVEAALFGREKGTGERPPTPIPTPSS